MRNEVLGKHNIKCAGPLTDNHHLWTERLSIYRALSSWLLSTVERPWILVDRSDLEVGRNHLVLKAVVPVGGRGLTVYEEVHSLKHYNLPKTHRQS